MKKLFLVLVIGFVVATAASYFGMQWRVQKSVDDFFSSLFFVDATYSDVSINLNGEILLSNIDLFVPATQLSIDISSVKVSTGGFWNTLSLEKELQEGRLPETLMLDVGGFSMDIDNSMMDALDAVYQPDNFAQITALGCGRLASIGPQEWFDMGIRNLTFDLKLGYVYDIATDEWVNQFEMYVDGVSHLIMNQTYLGLSRVMDDYRSVMAGFDPTSVSAVDLTVEFIDLGYNAKRQDFCAQKAGMEKQAWLELHRSMVSEALNAIEFDSNFNAIKLYDDVSSERSRMSVSLRPLPGFSMADLEFYDVSQMIELLDLDVRVNNEPIEISNVSWSQERFVNLDLGKIRRDFRVGPKEEASEDEETESETQRRILVEVPISTLEQHVRRQVLLERNDGKTFTGELMSVQGNQVIVRTRFRSGYTDLPLVRNDLSVAKLYPEN